MFIKPFSFSIDLDILEFIKPFNVRIDIEILEFIKPFSFSIDLEIIPDSIIKLSNKPFPLVINPWKYYSIYFNLMCLRIIIRFIKFNGLFFVSLFLYFIQVRYMHDFGNVSKLIEIN